MITSIIGLSLIGIKGLGNILVNGSNLFPKPPAIINAGILVFFLIATSMFKLSSVIIFFKINLLSMMGNIKTSSVLNFL